MTSVIRIHAIPLSDNDGGRAATLTAADLAVTVKQTNQYFLPAGIQFVFDPDTDWEPMKDSWLNSMDRGDKAWPSRPNAVAKARPGTMVVFFRWGTDPAPTGNGNAGPPVIGRPIPQGWKNERTDVEFVTMPSTQPLVDQGPAFLAHEVGHFLGLHHTFPGTSDGWIIDLKDKETLTPAQAEERLVRFIRRNNGSAVALDGDLVADTTIDPGTAFWTMHGHPECGGPDSVRLRGTLDLIPYDLTLRPPRDNIMSYYRCAEKSFTPGQIEKMQATIAHPSRSHLVQYQTRYDWSGWFPVGGTFHAGDTVAVVARRPGTFEVFGRASDGRLWQNDYPAVTPDGWTGWNLTAPGALASGPPSAVTWSADHVSLFFVGTDRQAWTCDWFDKTGWSGMHPLGGSFGAGESLAAVARTKGTFELFGRGSDGALWQNDYTAQGWTGWNRTAPGAFSSGPPSAVTWSADHVQLFFVGTDGQAWTCNWFDKTGWSGMHSLGGSFGAGESLAAIARSKDTFELFGRGSDGRLWQNDYPAATPNGWTGWLPTAPGLSPSGSPTALSHNADSVQVFALDASSALQTTYWGDLDA